MGPSNADSLKKKSNKKAPLLQNVFLQALCFGEDPRELSSVSAAKLALDAEEETDILVKSHRSGLNSSINQTLVQRH